MSHFVYATKQNVPEYVLKTGIAYRVVTDQLGSVKQVVNATTGEIVQSLDYDEYGNVFFDNNPGFTPFGFAGGLYDQHTKLVRFGARDYDASIGRWINKDPIGFESQVTNLYEFVSNDPINYTDPNGKWNWSRIWHNTCNYYNNAHKNLTGQLGMPGLITLGSTLLQGKEYSGLDWITFFTGTAMKVLGSSLIVAEGGSPGVLGWLLSGAETGLGAATGQTLIMAGGCMIGFEVGLMIGSAFVAIMDEIWN